MSEVWNSAEFKENILKQAREKRLLTSDEYPKRISLGGYWTNLFFHMHNFSLAQGNVEVAKHIKSDLDNNNLLVSKSHSVGNYISVSTEIKVARVGDRSEKKIAIIHTHPDSTPFSFTDLSHLLISPRALLIFLIQRNREVLLAFRTKETQKIVQEEALFSFRNNIKYLNYLKKPEQMIIANLLFAKQHNIVFYIGYLHLEKEEIIFTKKVLREKSGGA